jgi:hypothetical protein
MRSLVRWGIACALPLLLSHPALAAPKKGTLRVSGDNTWAAYVNGDKVAEGGDWQRPSVSSFDLKAGTAVIAVYVHDAEPAAAGRGGFLADIILDDKSYIGTGDKGWKADSKLNKPGRKDGWEKPGYDDSKWEEPQLYEQFGGGIWGFGAGTMRQVLNNPDCTARWIWAGPNDAADDVYFRYTLGGTFAVEPGGKLPSAWAALKAAP